MLKQAEDWFNQGNQQFDAGDFIGAIASYDKTLEIKPDYHVALMERGSALGKLGRFEEAIASYDKALEIKPDLHHAWFNRGNALVDLGQFEDTITSYDKALEFKPDHHQAWFSRGVALGNLGQFEEAITSFDKGLEFKPDDHEAWFNRGVALGNLEQFEEAIASYDKALEFKPDYHEAWHNRGVALAKLGQFEDAIASYDKALEIKPDLHHAWFNRGNALVDLEQFEEAITSYDKALEINSDYHKAWINRGGTLGNLGQFENAIDSYNTALEIKLDLHEAWISRGVVARISVACNRKLASRSAIAKENPDLNKRGYEGELASYGEGLKYCHQDSHPEGWGSLHHRIGKAHYFRGEQYPKPRSYWRKAVAEYNEALKTLTKEAFPQLHLEVLQDLIKIYLRLGRTAKAEELQRHGTDVLRRLLDEQNRSDWSKKQLALKFVGFNQLTVDIAVQSGQLVKALEVAEAGKNACLTWLLYAWGDEISSPSYQEIRQLLNPTTAAVYWHISPYALHTFILKQDAPEPTIILEETGFLSRLRRFEDWVKDWNQQYQDYRQGKTPLKQKPQSSYSLPVDGEGWGGVDTRQSHPQTTPLSPPAHGGKPESSYPLPVDGEGWGGVDPNWCNQLPEMLTKLSEVLNIPAILTAIQNPKSKIQNLILIPHRDLHRFPLHALFPSDIRITYLPSAKIGLNLLATDFVAEVTDLLSVENPKAEHQTGEKLEALPFAEIESEIISRMYSNPTRLAAEQATKTALTDALQQPHHIFHFTGHGSYNFNNPKLSALTLTGTDRLTLAEILTLPLIQCGYQLVSLSACETAITGNQTITTEYVGLVSSFLLQGVRNVVSTLWTVNSEASALVMIKFYNLLQSKSAAEALATATQWLRNLTVEELTKLYQSERNNLPENEGRVRPFLRRELSRLSTMEPGKKLYNHPYYWAAFTITGKI